jgi:hypothetical protein
MSARPRLRGANQALMLGIVLQTTPHMKQASLSRPAKHGATETIHEEDGLGVPEMGLDSSTRSELRTGLPLLCWHGEGHCARVQSEEAGGRLRGAEPGGRRQPTLRRLDRAPLAAYQCPPFPRPRLNTASSSSLRQGPTSRVRVQSRHSAEQSCGWRHPTGSSGTSFASCQ